MINSGDFSDTSGRNSALLGALGFKGFHRGGGIDDPIKVTLPVGAILLRFYRRKEAGEENPSDYGNWWFTPHEYRQVCSYFGTDGRPLIKGRFKGKSALHGVFAVRSEWSSTESVPGVNPRQLSLLNVVRVSEEIGAYYGHGAPSNADGYAETTKPIRVMGNKYARQIYIHNCWKYQSSLPPVYDETIYTDATVGQKSGMPDTVDTAPILSFER